MRLLSKPGRRMRINFHNYFVFCNRRSVIQNFLWWKKQMELAFLLGHYVPEHARLNHPIWNNALVRISHLGGYNFSHNKAPPVPTNLSCICMHVAKMSNLLPLMFLTRSIAKRKTAYNFISRNTFCHYRVKFRGIKKRPQLPCSYYKLSRKCAKLL